MKHLSIVPIRLTADHTDYLAMPSAPAQKMNQQQQRALEKIGRECEGPVFQP